MTASACPPADALLGFVAGALTAAAGEAIEAHIDACAGCRAALSSAARGGAASGGFGRYRVETVLGAGGMGVVYRGFDPALARPVAIKVVRGDRDDAAERARLAREARHLARLSHPHVCHVYDVGEDAADVWVAMELIDGVSLRAWAAGRAPAEVAGALIAAARGLAAAHAAGLVHRDIKPENVLVARDGRVVVTDFGLARVDDGAVTSRSAPGVVSGTPAYLAPEQLTAAPLDARVDQFAWAVMAWELLAGERPFPVEPAARLAAIRAGVAAPRGLPAAFAGPLVRALAPAPRDRFATMDALIAALEPPAAAPRSSAPVARRRAGIAAALIAVAGLALGAAALARWGGGGGRRADANTRSVSDAAATAPTAAAPLATAPLATAPPATAPPATALTAPLAAAPPSSPADVGAATPPSSPADGGAAAPRSAGRDAGPLVAAPLPPLDAAAADVGAAGPSLAAPSPPPDAGPAAVAAAPPTDPPGFDRARAERMLADCRFPVDPARPDAALAGAIVDWGPVIRHERVVGVGHDGEAAMSMFEIRGARGTYRFDGDRLGKLGSLAVAAGELVVVCPFELPPTSLVDRRELPPGWRSPTVPVYAFAPTRAAPRIATELAALAPLHVAESAVRAGAPGVSERALLVWARPRSRAGDRVDMGGWTLDAAGLTGDPLRLDQPIWLVIDRPTVEAGDGGQRVTARGRVARRRLLD